MVYLKNLPGWERALRLLAAAGMAYWAVVRHGGVPGAVALGAGAVITGLTAVFGFCPMCALAGRRLDAKLKSRHE